MRKFVSFFIGVLVLLSMVGFAAAAEKFPTKNVTISSSYGFSSVEGEITNNSGRSYTVCTFKFSFYDSSDKLLGSAVAAINNFEAGETVTFNAMSEKDVRGASYYKVRLEAGF